MTTVQKAEQSEFKACPIVPSSNSSNSPATRHARRVYVGGIPDGATTDSIREFFNTALMAVNGTTENLEGDAVMNVYTNMDKKFAFVEYRTGNASSFILWTISKMDFNEGIA